MGLNVEATITCHCRVCDKSYEWVRRGGRHVIAKLICPPCRQWHHWCKTCGPQLRSDFSTNRNRENPQERCRYCTNRSRTLVLHCSNCAIEFLSFGSRLNGKSLPMCPTCYREVKHCKKCDTIKPLEAFNRSSDKVHGRVAHCKQCAHTRWASTPLEQRNRTRLRVFGLTWDEYMLLKAAQDDRCKICGREETDLHYSGSVRSLSIDHDHTTGRIRGLLCGRCNKAIGLADDQPGILRAAADYLESLSG